MIRFIITASIVVLFLVLSIPIILLEWIIGKINMHARNISCYYIIQNAFRLCLFTSGVKVTVLGRENIQMDKPALYVLNHRSMFDILLLYSILPPLMGFVAKDSLKKAPLLNVWMHYVNCLFLNRSNPREGLKTILDAIAKIKSGISICICPEGTRSHTNEMLPFKEGSFKIALKTGCPIIPVALNNTAAIFEDHFPKIKKTHVVMEFGKPIEVDSMSPEEKRIISETAQTSVFQMLEKNTALASGGTYEKIN